MQRIDFYVKFIILHTVIILHISIYPSINGGFSEQRLIC